MAEYNQGDTYYLRSNKQPLTLGKQIALGGEAYIFEINNHANLVARLYIKNKLDHQKQQKIEQMVKLDFNIENITWPKSEQLICNSYGDLIGYLMEKINGCEVGAFLEQQKQQQQTDISNGSCPKIAYLRRIKNITSLCRNIADKMSRLHDKQILFADINEKNLMVDPKNYTPFFIDTDSYQFNDFITPVATPGYLAPEIDLQYLATNKRTNEHEYFALAVLFFYLINSEIHPFSIGKNPEPDKITEPDAKVKHLPFILEVTNTDPNYYTPKIYPKNKEAVILWQLMPQNLRNLFAQSFAKPPIKRPKPSEFASALGEFTNKLEEDIKNLLLNNAGTTSNHNLTTAKNLTRQATKIPNSGQTQLYQQYALQKIKQNKIRTYLVIGIIIILVSIILILITMNDNHPQDNYSSAKEAQTNQTQQIQNQQEDIKILPPQIQHKKHKPHEYKTSLENNTNNSDDLKTISRPKPTNTKPRIDNQNNYNNSLGDM